MIKTMVPNLPDKDSWNKFKSRKNPFLRYEFMSALEQSGSIGEEAGWLPIHVKIADSFLYTFIKAHSYGEFIFDWGWAEAYERHGIPYYPKLTSMIPFTPVSTNHFMMTDQGDEKKSMLLKQHDDFLKSSAFSSAHFLFVQEDDLRIFQEQEYHHRESLQYHFKNESYKDFNDFLSRLKNKKAKNIREERIFKEVVLKKFTGNNLTPEHADRMYEYYQQTIENKNSYAYLRKDFFKLIFQSMPEQILFIEAYFNDSPIAGSLFFFDEEKLYGRYWGSKQYVHNLHFELCYYQGIEFCIENKLKIFEAGAQGEHKVARGFVPTIIHSTHKLLSSPFHDAVGNFIEREKEVIKINQSRLLELLPFKFVLET